jgi:hypothetical protein
MELEKEEVGEAANFFFDSNTGHLKSSKID